MLSMEMSVDTFNKLSAKPGRGGFKSHEVDSEKDFTQFEIADGPLIASQWRATYYSEAKTVKC